MLQRLVTAAMLALIAPALAQTDTTITYQGMLLDGGAPAEGPHDFEFTLWDAAANGAIVGGPIWLGDVPVVGGGFTVELDFGPAAFNNEPRWLEIHAESFRLSPRQPVTRAPYALQTRGIVVDGPGNVGIGTAAPQAQLHVRGSDSTLRLEDTDDPGGYTLIEDPQPTQLRISKINTSGDVLLDLNPEPTDGAGTALVRFFRQTDTTGIKGLRIYRGDGTTSLSAIVGVDGANSAFQLHGGSFGIGTAGMLGRLTVAGGSEVGVHGTGAPGVYGLASGPADYGGTFAGAGAFGSGNSLLVAGDAHMLGHVGIGRTDPTARLDVETSGSMAVRALNTAGTYGLFAQSQSETGIGAFGQGKYGVYGFSSVGGFDSKGLYGVSNADDGAGVHGHATSGGNSAGVWGTNTGGGWAGFFSGDVRITGTLLANSKNFVIDNPLNPAEEYLVHACVESDAMRNLYDGVAVLDEHGLAVVSLPEWFDRLNGDFRYQLTCIGGHAPVYIAREIQGNAFTIAGGDPGMKISWQVTGVRVDPAAGAGAFEVIRPKPATERGTYLCPEGYCQPESRRSRGAAGVTGPSLNESSE